MDGVLTYSDIKNIHLATGRMRNFIQVNETSTSAQQKHDVEVPELKNGGEVNSGCTPLWTRPIAHAYIYQNIERRGMTA